MTTKTIFVLDPTAKANVPRQEMATRLEDLEGKKVGLLNNAKPNADIFLARVEELLSERYHFGGVIRRRAGGGASEELIAELAENCDFVLNAMGD